MVLYDEDTLFVHVRAAGAFRESLLAQDLIPEKRGLRGETFVLTPWMAPALDLPAAVRDVLLPPHQHLVAQEATWSAIRDPVHAWLGENAGATDELSPCAGVVPPHSPLPTPHSLLPYQVTALRWLHAASYRAVLGDDMGLGKTIVTLVALGNAGARRTLVVCPASVCNNWAREAKKWAPLLTVVVRMSGRSKKKVYEPKQPHPEPLVVVVSWDLLYRELAELRGMGFDTVVADEAHNAKSPAARRTHALQTIAWEAPRRLLLTGTDIRNRPNELWTLLQIVDPLRFRFYKRFAERFCGPRNKEVGNRLVRTYQGASNLAELNQLVRPYTMRRTKLEVLPQVPPKRRQPLWQTPPSALVALHEVLDGLDREDEESRGTLMKLWAATGLEKVDLAVDWIENTVANGEPVVVFFHHTGVHQGLEAALQQKKIRFTSIVGETPVKHRQGRVDAFQAGEVDVMLGSQAIKEGVTLTRAAHSLHVEPWWVPGDIDQAEDRLCRMGQDRFVVNTHLLFEDTIDQIMYELCERKRRVIRQVQDRSDGGKLLFEEVVSAWKMRMF